MLPRLATPRDTTRQTDGALGAFVAHLHGRPWLPWQRAAADVIGEKLPDGHYAYPVVVILVPRQCGKTTFVFDVAVGRGLDYVDYRAAYCAQTGHVTTERFTERINELMGTPLGRITRTRRSAGTERMMLRRGSYLKAFPPKDGALRSSALDLVVVDEAQEIDDDLGHALDATIIPTFNTRPRRQLILIGTAGTAKSGYMRRYLDAARAGEPGYAVIEYGVPAGADATDADLWPTWHPGLAAGLTDTDALRQARATLGEAGFLREYGNVWTVGTDVAAIRPEAWAAAAVPSFPLPARGVALAFDVAVDRSEAAIAAACRVGDQTHIRLLEQRPGTAWLTDRVEELAKRMRAPVCYDLYGPAVDIGAELGRRKLRDLTPYTVADYATACIGLAAEINDGTLTHTDQPPLNLAAATAGRRRLGDRWVWDRRAPGLPITPLIAATLARHILTTEQPRKKPVARA